MRYLLAVLCTGVWCNWINAATLHVEAYGDSLTAGFLAGTSVTSPPPLTEVSKMMSDMTSFKLADRTKLDKHHYPQLAWPQQVVNELKARGNPDIQLHNYAVSGSRSYHMGSQIRANKVADSSVAFFFIGHNDLCDDYPTKEDMVDTYISYVEDSLKQWGKSHKNSEAYVLPVGKVDEVYKLLAGYTWKKTASHDFTCDQNWERNFPYCRANFKRYKAATLDKYLKERITLMNTALEKLVLSQQKADSQNRYVYLTDTHNASYQKEHFAVDCFHLSEKGDADLASRVVSGIDKASNLKLY